MVGSCDSTNEQTVERSKPASNNAEVKEGDKRDAYLKPYEIFETLGGVGGKLVADIDAGGGYFVWKLLKAGAQVIAVCETQAEVDALNKEKASRGIADKNLTVRLRPLGQTGLGPQEADIVFVGTGLVGIADNVNYASQIFGNMKSGGILCSLEWKPIETPIGPAIESRYEIEQAMDILSEAGFTDVAAFAKTLPYHNILLGMEYIGDTGPISDQVPI